VIVELPWSFSADREEQVDHAMTPPFRYLKKIQSNTNTNPTAFDRDLGTQRYQERKLNEKSDEVGGSFFIRVWWLQLSYGATVAYAERKVFAQI